VLIAVHDRPLFDYLALELSPAFSGDELITIELAKSGDDHSWYTTDRRAFEPDNRCQADSRLNRASPSLRFVGSSNPRMTGIQCRVPARLRHLVAAT